MKPIDDEIGAGCQRVGKRSDRRQAECTRAPYARLVTVTGGNSGIGRTFVELLSGYGPS